MIIKQRVKFIDNIEGKKKCFTIVYSGRTQEELKGRIEKSINRMLQKGYELR